MLLPTSKLSRVQKMPKGQTREITRIVIHCADTWSKEALAQQWHKKKFDECDEKQQKKIMGCVDIGMHTIDSWHEAEGFSESPETKLHCGYHAVIRIDGTIEIARAEHEVGIHVKGHNHNSLGICLIGGRPEDSFTKEQMEALYAQLLVWVVRYGLEAKQVVGHKELNPKKTCPNISDMDKIRDELEVRLKGA